MALAYVSQPSRPLNEPQKFQGHQPLFEDRSNSSFSEKLSVISSKVASKSSVHLRGHGMRKLGRPSGSKNKLKGSNYGPAKPERHTLGHSDTRPVEGHLKKGLQLGSFPAEGLEVAPVRPPGTGPVGGHLQRGPLQGSFPAEGLGDATIGPPGTGPVGGHFQRGPLQGGQKMPLRDAPMLHRGQPIPNGGYPMQRGGLPMPRGDLLSPIQRMLDENAFLIRTISDFQNVGRNEESLHYQSMLHKNLMYLTGLAAEI